VLNAAEEISSLRSIIIEQHGEVLGSRFNTGRTANKDYNIKSASKSIIGLLTGIAIEKGFIPSVDEPISSYFSDYFERNPDSTKESITIKNLLSMQAGLRSTSSGNYGAWVISKNWVDYALKQDFVAEIDGRMVYSTGTSHLLSVIISKASGMSTRAFANKYLFNPMDIRVGGWDKDPQGYYMGGNNLALSPNDLLKIGRLLLNDGMYKGEKLISKDWIAVSFGTYTYSNYNPYGYGYQWWNQEVGGYPVFFAWGHGGQYIFMIPNLDAVIVVTSSVTAQSRRRTYKRPIFTFLEDQAIPLLEKRLQ
jgi:CubicO group peptidase (beta-lactamase class C family)